MMRWLGDVIGCACLFGATWGLLWILPVAAAVFQ